MARRAEIQFGRRAWSHNRRRKSRSLHRDAVLYYPQSASGSATGISFKRAGSSNQTRSDPAPLRAHLADRVREDTSYKCTAVGIGFDVDFSRARLPRLRRLLMADIVEKYVSTTSDFLERPRQKIDVGDLPILKQHVSRVAELRRHRAATFGSRIGRLFAKPQFWSFQHNRRKTGQVSYVRVRT